MALKWADDSTLAAETRALARVRFLAPNLHVLTPTERNSHPRLRSGFCLSGGVPKNREEMTDGSGDDQQMPGEVCIANSMRGKEANAGGVCDATREYPQETSQRNTLQNLGRRDHNQPAHDQIE